MKGRNKGMKEGQRENNNGKVKRIGNKRKEKGKFRIDQRIREKRNKKK